MSRYIDADAIIEKKWQAESEACFYALEDVVSVTDIEEAPSIDIVRCKECRYWSGCKSTMHNSHQCNRMAEEQNIDYWTGADDFCSYGERREP